MRLAALAPQTLALLALLGACRREAPPNAGEPERPAEARRRFVLDSAGTRVVEDAKGVPGYEKAPRSPGAIAVVTGSGNRFLLSDVATCTLSSFTDGVLAWRGQLPGCAGFFQAALANDGTAFARTRTELASFAVSGGEQWRLALADVHPIEAVARPVSLLDGRVALATSSSEVAVFAAPGQESWRLRLPEGEPLVAAPQGRAGSGLVLLTNRAAYFVGSDGAVERRHLLVVRPP